MKGPAVFEATTLIRKYERQAFLALVSDSLQLRWNRLRHRAFGIREAIFWLEVRPDRHDVVTLSDTDLDRSSILFRP